MTFPASANVLGEQFNKMLFEVRRLKKFAQEASTFMAANNVSANQVLDVMTNMQQSVNSFTVAQGIPGMVQHARDELSDQALDVAAEFIAMKAAAQAVVDWVDVNFPKDGAGYLLKDKIANGSLDVRVFTPALTAGLRTELDAFVATVS